MLLSMLLILSIDLKSLVGQNTPDHALMKIILDKNGAGRIPSGI
jgi:hypothetical protein